MVEQRATLPTDAPPTTAAMLQREELELLNAALLHELYFASIGGAGTDMTAALDAAFARDFGSADRWRSGFQAMALSLGDRHGARWAMLSWVPRLGRLITHASTSNAEAIAGGLPLLALDISAHTRHPAFAIDLPAYVAGFLGNIDWAAVHARYEAATQVPPPGIRVQGFGELPSISPEEVQATLPGHAAYLLDVRPKQYLVNDPVSIDGAVWRDPDRIDEWIAEVPGDAPVIAFCAYGFDVGCQVTARLRTAGIDARYMTGGYFAWKAISDTINSRTES